MSQFAKEFKQDEIGLQLASQNGDFCVSKYKLIEELPEYLERRLKEK